MNHFLRASTALAATAAVLSIATASLAQDQAQPGPGQRPTAEQRMAWMQQRQEAHAKALHDVLNLRPDQEAAFQAFQAAMTPAHHEHGDHAGQPQGPMTTPQRLDRMEARMAKREQAFQARATAIKTFYAVLSPEQQRAFDALPMMMGGDHQGRGHGPMGRGPGGPSHEG